MTTKIVCRLLDAENQILGWTEVYAKARGDGKLWSQGPVSIVIKCDGNAQELSLHWADVNVETRVPFTGRMVFGQIVTVYAAASPLIVVGPAAGGLPPVTVRSVAVGIPAGGIGARG